MTSTAMHAELIEHGWRVDLDGRWISPDPNNARFTFRDIHAAWREHRRLEHVVDILKPKPKDDD